ncbi:unnamed protein product [Thelazia callipaeda]|uniref:UBA domain-containing protein n=1 Tax=Thelazia callipaeda TaxID=103827 RepID=A0A0N5DC90_THECL|nr:unnamed protein product [Thelazia callipaeda]
MVNVWLVKSGSNIVMRSFGREKSVKEILDEVVTDQGKRTMSHLVFFGRALEENVKLFEVGDIKDSHTLHVVVRCNKDINSKPQLDNKKLLECREKFRFLKASKSDRDMMMEKLLQDDFIKDLLIEFPVLKHDQEALIISKDYLLSYSFIMNKQKNAERFLHDHPILVHVIHYWLRDVLLPARMPYSISNSSLTEIPPPEQDGFLPVITQEMLREAMAQATRNMSTGNTNQEVASSSAVSQNSTPFHDAPASSSPLYAKEVVQLVEFGFTDREQNRQILEETHGNVEQALELLIALRESMMDFKETPNN